MSDKQDMVNHPPHYKAHPSGVDRAGITNTLKRSDVNQLALPIIDVNEVPIFIKVEV